MKLNRNNINFGSILRAIRVASCLTQETIAQKLNISIPAYSKIESGITDLSLSRIDHLAAIYGISTLELLTYNQDLYVPERSELDVVLLRIAQKEAEIYNLQKILIELYEELRLLEKNFGDNE